MLCDLYDALAPHGRTVAAGCGPDVGIAGLTLGGGLGILGRTHGLTSDQLVAAEVVLADGRVVDCDEHTHPDLFWALRGAGGGQIGVVTRFVLRTVPAPETTTLHLVWPHGDGAALLEAWQGWSPDAPDAVAASLLVTAGADPSDPPRVHVFGAMLAGEAETRAQLRALIDRAGAEPRSTELRMRRYRQAKAHLSDHGPGDEPSPDAHGWSKSEFFREPVPRPAVAALLEHVAADRAPGQLRVLDLSPWAGAYNRVAPDATAFPHRAERFLIKHDVVVDAPPDAAARERAVRWLRRSWRARPSVRHRRRVPELPRPRARGRGTGLPRRQPRPPGRGQGRLRPRRRLPLPAIDHARRPGGMIRSADDVRGRGTQCRR